MTWSYSKLSTYERCPALYRYKYKLKLGNKELPPAVKRGIDVHESIERYFKGKGELHEAVTAYLPLFRRVKSHCLKHCLEVEKEICVDVNWSIVPRETSWCVGYLDCAYVTKKGVEIFEWKTGGIYDHHDDQRALYLLLAKAAWPDAGNYHIRTYYFDKSKHIDMSLEEKLVEPMKADFKARVAIMQADDIFAPKPGHYCKFCEFAKSAGGQCEFG